ncbi:MAG: hypothetical protein WB383_07850 [Acidimicrobiales bacterium]
MTKFDVSEMSTDANDIARAVGRVALNWAHLEAMTSITLWTLANLPRVSLGTLLTNGVPVATQWDQIQVLLHSTKQDALLEWFTSWRCQAAQLQGSRNEAVHSQWFPTGDHARPFEAWDLLSRKARADARRNVMPGGVTEVDALADSIAVSFRDLQNWLLKDVAAALGRVTGDDEISTVLTF